MKVFFVIDIKDGAVVAGKKGERDRYSPISESSPLVTSSDPFDVVSAVRPRYLYAADLDKIMGRGDNTLILNQLAQQVEELIADCGFRSPEELEGLSFTPVLGTETYDITKVVNGCYVSLDFKEGFMDASGKFGGWKECVEFLNSFDLHVIVLNIGTVGTMRADFGLLEKVMGVSDNPVLLGGGISGVEDLERLKGIGCSGVLVATAVHRGRIPLEVVRRGEF